jgi:phage host-nuclease inhibitor protein Gam
VPILLTTRSTDWSTVTATDSQPEGAPKEQFSPAEQLEQTGNDYTTWKRLNAEVQQAESRLRLAIALALTKWAQKIADLVEQRRQVAQRLADAYDLLSPRYTEKGSRTVHLPGDGAIRKQAAGGKPEIEVLDKTLAIAGIRRRRLAKRFLTWTVSLHKRRLQEEPELASEIPGLEVNYPPEGFFIDGHKVDLKPAAIPEPDPKTGGGVTD